MEGLEVLVRQLQMIVPLVNFGGPREWKGSEWSIASQGYIHHTPAKRVGHLIVRRWESMDSLKSEWDILIPEYKKLCDEATISFFEQYRQQVSSVILIRNHSYLVVNGEEFMGYLHAGSIEGYDVCATFTDQTQLELHSTTKGNYVVTSRTPTLDRRTKDFVWHLVGKQYTLYQKERLPLAASRAPMN